MRQPYHTREALGFLTLLAGRQLQALRQLQRTVLIADDLGLQPPPHNLRYVRCRALAPENARKIVLRREGLRLHDGFAVESLADVEALDLQRPPDISVDAAGEIVRPEASGEAALECANVGLLVTVNESLDGAKVHAALKLPRGDLDAAFNAQREVLVVDVRAMHDRLARQSGFLRCLRLLVLAAAELEELLDLQDPLLIPPHVGPQAPHFELLKLLSGRLSREDFGKRGSDVGLARSHQLPPHAIGLCDQGQVPHSRTGCQVSLDPRARGRVAGCQAELRAHPAWGVSFVSSADGSEALEAHVPRSTCDRDLQGMIGDGEVCVCEVETARPHPGGQPAGKPTLLPGLTLF